MVPRSSGIAVLARHSDYVNFSALQCPLLQLRKRPWFPIPAPLSDGHARIIEGSESSSKLLRARPGRRLSFWAKPNIDHSELIRKGIASASSSSFRSFAIRKSRGLKNIDLCLLPCETFPTSWSKNWQKSSGSPSHKVIHGSVNILKYRR
jgi:hypothetical protein